ncbi:LysR family transcriptional regulator [Nocardia wallacei]|uniref:LysR family transcriptional regulator n=1 Tax=Nocardia wallacei TaxID=480035 RepID=UPI0024587154|nr:LysR family transcriptional regulator [Nocardia wallacei]
MDVDTRVLRYFVAVADHLSFSRAADSLYVSQPTVSRQIRQLESDLQTRLFDRSGREVRLTAAGESLVPIARGLLADWQAGERTVRGVAAARAAVVRVGFEATGAGPLGTRARTRFAALHPEVTIEPKRLDWGGEADALREGLVDVAFLWLPADLTGLRTKLVAVEQRWVGMAVDHPLAERGSVAIMDLRAEAVLWTRRAPREWVDWWAVNPRPDGSEPIWGPHNDNVEEMLDHVAAGAGICISPHSMAVYHGRPDLAWRPIVDIAPLRIAVARPASAVNPMAARFADVVAEVSELREK